MISTPLIKNILLTSLGRPGYIIAHNNQVTFKIIHKETNTKELEKALKNNLIATKTESGKVIIKGSAAVRALLNDAESLIVDDGNEKIILTDYKIENLSDNEIEVLHNIVKVYLIFLMSKQPENTQAIKQYTVILNNLEKQFIVKKEINIKNKLEKVALTLKRNKKLAFISQLFKLQMYLYIEQLVEGKINEKDEKIVENKINYLKMKIKKKIFNKN